MSNIPCTPIAPRCRSGKYGCNSPATHWLIDPTGEPCPGGWICAEHGATALVAMKAALGELWRLAPLNLGTTCHGCGELSATPALAATCCAWTVGPGRTLLRGGIPLYTLHRVGSDSAGYATSPS